jgi:hypothetical protein
VARTVSLSVVIIERGIFKSKPLTVITIVGLLLEYQIVTIVSYNHHDGANLHSVCFICKLPYFVMLVPFFAWPETELISIHTIWRRLAKRHQRCDTHSIMQTTQPVVPFFLKYRKAWWVVATSYIGFVVYFYLSFIYSMVCLLFLRCMQPYVLCGNGYSLYRFVAEFKYLWGSIVNCYQCVF